MNRVVVLALGVVVLACAPAVWAQRTAEAVFPEERDPFVGEYVGRWSADVEVNPNIAAQIISLGRGDYRVIVKNKLDMRCPPWADVEVEPKDGKLIIDAPGLQGETDGQSFTGDDGRGESTFTMERVERLSPTLGAEPPEGATVLFDGSNFDAWTGTEHWELVDGDAMMVTPKADYLVSKGAWKDITLHIEFRTPWMPKSRGQQRGNSGVFIQDEYEVQVLDSFGLEGFYNECGALYKLSAPHVNACRPPLQWQTYDIEYTAPRYNEAGELEENGYMTVYHNGVLIHNEQELKWITAWKEVERHAPPPREPGHIKLQAHNDFVQFRNIWLVDRSGE